MSCEGVGNVVPETVKRVVSVLVHGFCPFDIALLSSSIYFCVFVWY